jgi:hypothetical protein
MPAKKFLLITVLFEGYIDILERYKSERSKKAVQIKGFHTIFA